VILGQDRLASAPQKVGFVVTDGWAAYARDGHLFVKKFSYFEGERYPDFGCSVEVFTDADMLELETLGPLARLQPGDTVEHIEHWFLFRDVPAPIGESDVECRVLPKVEEASSVQQ
jgi:hypothetical protein